MTKFIYESPDGGKTVTRRPQQVFDSEAKELQVSEKRFYPLSELSTMMQDMLQQEALREKYPMLKAAWEEYETMLKLIRGR